MYVLPLLVILLICLAIFFSPILAVVFAIVFMAGLGVYKFLGPGTEPEHASPTNRQTAADNSRVGAGTGESNEDDEETGPWGETWPEKS